MPVIMLITVGVLESPEDAVAVVYSCLPLLLNFETDIL